MLSADYFGSFVPQMPTSRLRFEMKEAAMGRPPFYARLNRGYFDSVVYDARTLRFVSDLAGADHVVMGTIRRPLLGELGVSRRRARR